nr:hypothetical protein [Azospirillum thiophilum]
MAEFFFWKPARALPRRQHLMAVVVRIDAGDLHPPLGQQSAHGAADVAALQAQARRQIGLPDRRVGAQHSHSDAVVVRGQPGFDQQVLDQGDGEGGGHWLVRCSLPLMVSIRC